MPGGLELFPSNASTVLASPDGRAIAFVGTSGGNRQLYLRRLDAFDATPLRGTVGATVVAFSPDSKAVVFVTSGGELKTVSLTDGLVAQVTRDASLLHGIAWLTSDQIIFTRAGAIWSARINGEVERLTTISANEQNHGFPSALPDGRTIIFTVETAAGSHLEALTVADRERKLLLNQAWKGKLGPANHLFFYRDNRLLAVAFDAAKAQVTGSPTADRA